MAGVSSGNSGPKAGGRVRIGVLISGRGSNLQALIEAAAHPDYPAEIALVIANVPEAAGLERAEAAGLPTQVVDHRLFPSRVGFEAALTDALHAADCGLVCLAGFMRVLTADFVERWRDRLINIHPSLLPAFPGLNTHAEALAAGVRITGATVHFVREQVDQGPIIGQAAVPVHDDDDAETLGARVLAAEHRLYPHCVRLAADGRATISGNRVRLHGAEPPRAALLNPPVDG
ncbi:phosphoribosylglycinamide formyltransferase [Rhodovibrio sodomensis]|uniref:Phosphoribosylglycinamide formyltransferase n=1 Tax=Rhodovibrio sodomensis TaxID=1088 RepID=A0ABS1DG38_9PROT|nr:phosphoribosylglycinamide formyltransferase [Rhodovibrio sodomensis]MBK1668854.1 phosphoribosylglycinamide formyltransferase [Rhodovibrio sodomensis]